MAVLSGTRQDDRLVVTLLFIACPSAGIISGIMLALRIHRSTPTKVLAGVAASLAFTVLCAGLCVAGCMFGNAAR